MLATVYALNGVRDLVRREDPLDLDGLAPDAVAARTLVSAISPGTEVAAYVGLPPLRPMQVYPRVVGYCNVAEVVAVGDAVDDLRPGDRIASFQSHRSGFVCPRADVAAVLPPDADVIRAATTYLFHLGYSALLRADARAGHNIAVIGVGTIGLATVAVAAMAGARVFALSDQGGAAELAGRAGAERRLPKRENEAGPAISEATGGIGADIVITTSNRWQDWTLALQLARVGGRIAVLGFPGRGLGPPPDNPLDSAYLYDKQLTILGCGQVSERDLPAQDVRFTLARNYAFLLDRVLAGDLPVDALVSAVVPWTELGALYERMAAREPGLLTAVLDWRIDG